MKILGIETSCDETSVAVVEDGWKVLGCHVTSQTAVHEDFGGVVPELASRAHIRRLLPMIEQTLESCDLTPDDIDAYAVTLGPGLVGALLVGVESAKALAFAFQKPLIPVHHVAAHIYSIQLRAAGGHFLQTNLLAAGPKDSAVDIRREFQEAESPYPYIALVVSGGHSSLVLSRSATHFEVLAYTVDDAAGEAFDKLAKLLDLGFPGGPKVQAAAVGGDVAKFKFPRPLSRAEDDHRFSFSGLKTAALKEVQSLGGAEAVSADPQLLSDICASFQEAVVETLLRKSGHWMERLGIEHLAIVGGVACNTRLREATGQYLPTGSRVSIPPPFFCTDNAAMIAGLAWHHRDIFERVSGLGWNASASLPLDVVRLQMV